MKFDFTQFDQDLIEVWQSPTITVYEQDPEPTGLLDPEGRPLVRKGQRIGSDLGEKD